MEIVETIQTLIWFEAIDLIWLWAPHWSIMRPGWRKKLSELVIMQTCYVCEIWKTNLIQGVQSFRNFSFFRISLCLVPNSCASFQTAVPHGGKREEIEQWIDTVCHERHMCCVEYGLLWNPRNFFGGRGKFFKKNPLKMKTWLQQVFVFYTSWPGETPSPQHPKFGF